MSKRLRFIATSVFLSLGFLGMQFLEGNTRFFAIFVLVIFTLGLFYWSLYEGLEKNMTLISLALPALFTLGVGIFWFLLPSNIFTKIPIVVFYAVGIYVLALTMNIYTVSAIRTIALLRAARGVGFVLTLTTSFLIFNLIVSLRQNILYTFLLYFVSSFILFLQGFWSMELEKKPSVLLLQLSFVSSLTITQIAISIFFWPVTVVVASLFLTSGVYILLGLGQARQEERLFASTVKEYTRVGIVMLLGLFFATHWG